MDGLIGYGNLLGGKNGDTRVFGAEGRRTDLHPLRYGRKSNDCR